MDITEQYQLWDSFLQRWPRERLNEMTLEQYVSVDDQDTFTYWLETKAGALGSIKGNTSAKFGIYKRKKEDLNTQNGIKNGEVYSWWNFLGETETEAFSTVKKYILDIVDAVSQGSLDKIEEIYFSSMVKWKIAFLYQNRESPYLINIFSKPMLQVLVDENGNNTYTELYQSLMEKRSNIDIVSYGETCWINASNKKQAIENQKILSQFFHVEQFEKNYRNWSQDVIQGFCDLISEANKQKIDVFTTKMITGTVIRLGRKEQNTEKAIDVLAGLTPQQDTIKYQDQDFSGSINDELIQYLKSSKILNKYVGKHPITRKAYLPKDYLTDGSNSDDIDSVSSEETLVMNKTLPLNQILFGPPGTGKTYHTIEAAVKAAEPTFTWSDRDELKAKYDALVNEKRIRFVTFHQSFGYEDFVEGLKAESINGQIQYNIVAGVLKNIVEAARAKKIQTLIQSSAIDLSNRNIWKMSLGNSQTDEGGMIFKECIENNWILLGYGDDIDFSGCTDSDKIKEKFKENGYEPKNQDYSVTSVNTFVNKMSVGDIVIISDGNYKYKAIAEVISDYERINEDRDWYYQKRDVRWLMVFEQSRPIEELFSTSLSQMTLYNLKDTVIYKDKLSSLLNESEKQLVSQPNYVLVIDEVNRGNISKIFGELITLIEPSKRDGASESLSLNLAYSKEAFSVPNNLYIIGTMNTADRSLTMLDTALRRRFDFIEMMPKPSLLQCPPIHGIDLVKLLTILNQRIEVLYDREHTLGHAFLMPVKLIAESDSEDAAFDSLVSVFQNKIIPLLQEYFFEDWQKIRLVLGDNQKPADLQFVTEEKLTNQSLDALFGIGHGLNPYGDEQRRYTLQLFSESVWQDPQAYLSIYSKVENKKPESEIDQMSEGAVAS